MAQPDPARSTGEAAAGVDWPAELARHQSWLRTVVLARLRDGHAVDEVLQEVATAAIEKGHQLREPAKAAAWLYRLAVVTSLRYRRREGRRRKLLDRYARRVASSLAESDAVDPLDWLVSVERRALVREALGQLPGREAEILLLKYSEDWTYRQIAEHLGLSESAVEARLHRARRRLRQSLAALDPARAGARTLSAGLNVRREE